MFDIKTHFYSLMILLSLIANIIIVMLISKKYSISKKEIICLLLYENIGIIGGAKLYTFIQKYEELKGQFAFLSLGLTAYGGIIGALIFLLLFSLQFKKSFKEILYIFMPSIPVMYGISKIGCYFSGCCNGIEINAYIFPVQIIESIVFILIFIYMLVKHTKNQFDLKALGISAVLCGCSKFVLDYFRYSHIGIVLSFNQIISIIVIIIGVIVIIFNKLLLQNTIH